MKVGKDTSKKESSERLHGAIIGASATLLIAVCAGFFFFGGFNEKIQYLSDKLTNIETNNNKLSYGLTLTNNILTRVLNQIDISENEKTAIYNEINKTISEISKSNIISSTTQTQATMHFSQGQTNAPEPEYMKVLIQWSKKFKP